MQLTQLKTAKDVHALYSPDKQTDVLDHNGTDLFKPKACTKLIFIERDGKTIASSEWFITQANNELIYDIESNNWVNLTMFDEGDSYCAGIYTVELENETDRIDLVPPVTLTVPSFVANWYAQPDITILTEDGLFDHILKWEDDDDEDSLMDIMPSEMYEYIEDNDNRLTVLRLLSGERFNVSD